MNKSIVSVALSIGLLAGSAIGVAAQDEAPNLDASAFEATTADPADIAFDSETGIERLTGIPVDATDPRASGLMSVVEAHGGMCSEFDRVIDGIVDCSLPIQQATRSGVRLVNDGGAWVGTRIEFEAAQLDERTKKQKKKGKGQAPVNGRGGLVELTGEGDYAGLSMIAKVSPKGMIGIIVPTATLPEQPEAPAAAEAVADEPATEEAAEEAVADEPATEEAPEEAVADEPATEEAPEEAATE